MRARAQALVESALLFPVFVFAGLLGLDVLVNAGLDSLVSQATSAGAVTAANGAPDNAVRALVVGASQGSLTNADIDLTVCQDRSAAGAIITITTRHTFRVLSPFSEWWVTRNNAPIVHTATVPTVQPCVP